MLRVICPGILCCFVMADGAADRSAYQTVMMSQMAGYATDDRASDAALGLGRACRSSESEGKNHTG
jgi:hypothetical protein